MLGLHQYSFLAWMKYETINHSSSLDDETDALLPKAKPVTPSGSHLGPHSSYSESSAQTRERYISFGIGGVGNMRRSVYSYTVTGYITQRTLLLITLSTGPPIWSDLDALASFKHQAV
jgi:hypothetical protein